MPKIFDVCIIGSGPAGIFTAMGLVDRYDVLVLELGNKFSDRQYCRVIDDNDKCRGCDGKCNIITGFGGSFCSKSGGTLSLYPAGSSLVEYYDTLENLLADYNKAIKIWQNYSEDEMSYEGSTDKEEIITFSKKVNDFGGIYKHYNVFKMNKSNLDKTIQRLEHFISSKAKLEFNSEVISVKKAGELWQIKCRNGNLYTSKIVVFATGRKGNSFTSRILKKIGVDYKKTGIDLGVRLELSKDKIDDLVELHPDVKIKFDINGEEVRTFCFCPKGKIVHFNQDSLCSAKSMNFLEGCVDDNNLSDRTNIAFLHRINFNNTDEVFEFQRAFEEKYYSLGGKVVSQRFNDVGKTIFSPLPSNTTLNDYFIGSIFSLLPEKTVFVLLEAINRFDRMMDGKVLSSNTVIAAPEIGNFWPEIDMDKNFQTNIQGIFVAGDTLGFTRGALQASVTGIKTSGAVAEFLEK